MSGIKVIFNKEMRRVFKEPKMIFSLFLLPVILMIGIYGLVGMLTKNMMEDVQSHTSIVYMQNVPEQIEDVLADFTAGAQVTELTSDMDLEALKRQVADGAVDMIVIFPENFMDMVNAYETGAAIPDIAVYYNPSEDYSSEAWSRLSSVLDDVVRPMLLSSRVGDLSLLEVFTVNAAAEDGGIVINEQKAAGKALSMLLPYLITMLLFAGTMSLGTDAITGEKERGTMASMLVTPVKRRNIVLGKMLALTVMSILSAVIYIVVLIVAMPAALGTGDMQVTLGAGQIAMIAVLMMVLAFFYVAVVGLVAVLAKDMKEASTYVSPLYILVIVAGMITMLSTGGGHEFWEYLIPVYGSALSLGEIFTQELTVAHFAMNAGCTLVLGLLVSGAIVKCFDNERIMFNA